MPREREYLAMLDNGDIDRVPFSQFEETHALFLRDGFGWDSEYSDEFDYWTILMSGDKTRTYVRSNPRRRPPSMLDAKLKEGLL